MHMFIEKIVSITCKLAVKLHILLVLVGGDFMLCTHDSRKGQFNNKSLISGIDLPLGDFTEKQFSFALSISGIDRESLDTFLGWCKQDANGRSFESIKFRKFFVNRLILYIPEKREALIKTLKTVLKTLRFIKKNNNPV